LAQGSEAFKHPENGFELGSFGFVSGCSVRVVFFVTSFERRICKIGNWVRSAIFFSRRFVCHFGEVDRALARVVTLFLPFVHINNPLEKTPARYVFHAMVSGRDNARGVPGNPGEAGSDVPSSTGPG
jgi:hypothetical protein